MSGIRVLLSGICLTLMASTLFSMLMPKSSMEGVFRFALSLFFLLSLVLPFLQGDLDFSFDMDLEQTQIGQDWDTQTEDYFFSLAEQNIAARLEEFLRQKGERAEWIEVKIHSDENHSISISRMKIKLASSDPMKQKLLAAQIEEAFGMAPAWAP